MIVTLIHIALVLVGIMLLTLIYYFVMRVVSSRATATTRIIESNATIEPEQKQSDKKTQSQTRAVVRCSSIPPVVARRCPTIGFADCNVQNMFYKGASACEWGCIGLGSCARMCPTDAIIIRDGQIAITDACNGCGRCVRTCPKKLIQLVPVAELAPFSCIAAEKSGLDSICQNIHSTIDYANLPKSGFKIGKKWSILSQKSRYE